MIQIYNSCTVLILLYHTYSTIFYDILLYSTYCTILHLFYYILFYSTIFLLCSYIAQESLTSIRTLFALNGEKKEAKKYSGELLIAEKAGTFYIEYSLAIFRCSFYLFFKKYHQTCLLIYILTFCIINCLFLFFFLIYSFIHSFIYMVFCFLFVIRHQ